MFLKGLLLGFSVATPIGPINLLCIQRTLARGRLHGFVSGLGAATADTAYGIVAALGLGTITSFLLNQQFWLQLIGGIFLLVVGLKTALIPPQDRPATATDDAGLARAYFSILLLTPVRPTHSFAFRRNSAR